MSSAPNLLTGLCRDEELLNDFYGVVWALRFAGSTDKALIDIYNIGFAFVNLKESNWTDIDACCASIAFVNINFYLHHRRSILIFGFLKCPYADKKIWGMQ